MSKTKRAELDERRVQRMAEATTLLAEEPDAHRVARMLAVRWQIGRREATRYVRAAQRYWRLLAAGRDLRDVHAELLGRTEEIYRRAMQTDRLTVALKAADRIAEIRGLELAGPLRVELSTAPPQITALEASRRLRLVAPGEGEDR